MHLDFGDWDELKLNFTRRLRGPSADPPRHRRRQSITACLFFLGAVGKKKQRCSQEGVKGQNTHVDLGKCRWQFAVDALERPGDIDWAAEMAE